MTGLKNLPGNHLLFSLGNLRLNLSGDLRLNLPGRIGVLLRLKSFNDYACCQCCRHPAPGYP